jgi:microcystin-dependent protein
MPRNSQGLYTLPAGNPVVPNTLIESVWANSTMDDIAVALTASLPRDGSAPMTGDLTLAAGGPQTSRSAVSRAYVDSFLSYATGMPVGAILTYAGGVAPPGFLLCDGSAVSRTTYAALFAAVGTIYGSGDNATTFNVPDLRNQFIRGQDSASRALGSTQAGSFAAHTHPVSDPGHTHGASQASHWHNVTTGGHSHSINDSGHTHSQIVSATPGSGFAYGTGNVANGTTGASGTGISINGVGSLGGNTDAQQPAVTVASATTGETIGSTGGTETVPQNIALAYYIKAEVDVPGGNVVVAIQSSDTNMIAIDETNPAIPVLDIKSNVAFGTVKLDSAGQIPVNLMPTTGVTYQGQLDASSGNLPIGTFVTGDFYNIAVGGTLSLMTSTGGPIPKTVVTGDQIIYDTSIGAWWYSAASSVASMPAASVTFVPTGTVAATNVQSAIEEVASESVQKSGGTMTGALKNTASQIGTSATATDNFSLEPTTAGAMKLARGNAGATTQDVLVVDSTSAVRLPVSPLRINGATARLEFWASDNSAASSSVGRGVSSGVANDLGLSTVSGDIPFSVRNLAAAKIYGGTMQGMFIGQSSTSASPNINLVNNNGTGVGFVQINHTGNSVGNWFVQFANNGTQQGAITGAAGNTVVYGTSSDYRLKDSIKDLSGSGAFIDALLPRSWVWKSDNTNGAGFIAHEMQPVSPSSVVGKKDAEQMQMVAYSSSELIANMVAELKSLRARVAELENKQ